MTYIDHARQSLEKALPDQPPELLDLYLLLALCSGTETTAEGVHDAWAIWRSRTRSDHPAIVPFGDLTPDAQRLDDEYVEAIRQAAATERREHDRS